MHLKSNKLPGLLQICFSSASRGKRAYLQLCGGQDEGYEGEENDERDRENDGGNVVTPGTVIRIEVY